MRSSYAANPKQRNVTSNSYAAEMFEQTTGALYTNYLR